MYWKLPWELPRYIHVYAMCTQCTAYCKCNHFCSLKSWISVSKSLLPCFIEKRPMRLRLEIEMKWHPKCNRLFMYWQCIRDVCLDLTRCIRISYKTWPTTMYHSTVKFLFKTDCGYSEDAERAPWQTLVILFALTTIFGPFWRFKISRNVKRGGKSLRLSFSFSLTLSYVVATRKVS